MNTLEKLAADAQALAAGQWVPTSVESEAARQLQICNACRYCEGFCAVFPAMTRRLTFTPADLHFMANLCHNCGACLHACQYAPPHDFGVNIPRVMAQLRVQTYSDFAWPAPLGKLYKRNGLMLSLTLAAGLALFLWLAQQKWGIASDNFYSVFPHNQMVSLFAPVFLAAVFAMAMGVRRFWRDITPATGGYPVQANAAAEAAHDVLRLKYLGGGHGDGCNNEDDAFSLARRRAHHLTFYGFMLCFAATSVATLYHYLWGMSAPYDFPSLPKVLGVLGGVSLLVGTAGLFKLNLQRHPLQGDEAQKPMDLGFIALLFLISASGLALWLARGYAGMPVWLAVHLGAVMALFTTLPYNKFAHGIFRTAALVRHAVEKRQPSPIGLGND
jgi:citrate/tricarballylate utilization protein